MRKRIVQFIASSPHLGMLLICCLISQTSLAQQLTNYVPDTNLDLLYGLFMCAPIGDSMKDVALRPADTGATLAVNDSGTLVLDTLSIGGLLSKADMEIQNAQFDTETEMLMERFAEMIEEEPEELGNLRLYKFIDDWYGVRYKYGGTTIRGIDCSAFSQKVYGQIYCLNILRTSRQQYRHCERIKRFDEAKEGDLVFFRINRMRISHVGIYLANGYFVHASRSRGVVVSSLNDHYWKRRYAGCGRLAREESKTESGIAVPADEETGGL